MSSPTTRGSLQVWVPMLTAFDPDGAIDWQGMDGLIDWYLDAGVAGLLGVCLSGEMNHLSEAESFALASHVARRVGRRVPVAVPCPLNTPQERQADSIRLLRDAGVDVVPLVTNQLPAFPTDKGALLDAVERTLKNTDDIALGIYECPFPCRRPLPPDIVRPLASSDRFVFYKDTTAQIDQIAAKCRAASGTRLRLYNAHIPSISASLALGAAGPCCIAANYFPRLLVTLCDNLQQEPEWAARVVRFLAEVEQTLHRDYPRSAKRYAKRRRVSIRETCRVDRRQAALAVHQLEALSRREESLLQDLGSAAGEASRRRVSAAPDALSGGDRRAGCT